MRLIRIPLALPLLIAGCGSTTPPADPPPKPVPPAATPAEPVEMTAGCPSECRGRASADFEGALLSRSPQARRCFEIATSAQPDFGGRLLVTLELSESGHSCAVTVTSAVMALPEPFVRCLEKTYAGSYPAPQGGCVRAVLPLNFVSENADAGAPP